jgi:conjugative transposon TraM protein
MAAKYLPAAGGTPVAPGTVSGADETGAVPAGRNTSGKTAVVPVGQVRERTVSALPQEMSSVEIVEELSQPRNMGFLTAAADRPPEAKNTIGACIHDDRTVTDGQNVRLRLTEPMQAGKTLIPRHTLLTGTAKIQGERLDITVHSLEYQGMILPVELRVFDFDGQPGIFIPDLQAMNAVKEIAANTGANAGTNISLSSNAGEQFVADMGRGLVQGTSQFLTKKLREIKVHLKAGYHVFLLPDGN